MCRNIRTLFNFEPPASEEEMRAASIQFIRKISGSTKPSHANQAAFEKATDDVTLIVRELLESLVTAAPAKDLAIEAAKAKARARERFGSSTAARPA